MASASVEAQKTVSRGAFLRSKLASLLAVAPLGVWTVWHVWSNLSAFGGKEAWEESVTGARHPLQTALTMAMVLLPIALHTIWGLQRITRVQPNNDRYTFFGNVRFILQRASALGVLGFLGAHIFKAFVQPRFLEGHPEAFENISAYMHHHTPTLVVYLLGTLGVAYHLGNGLQSFAMGWGIATSKKGLRRVEIAGLAFFVVLTVMAWAAIYAMFKAGAAFPAPAH